MPVYQLLGGASRDGVMVYGHANGADIEQTVEWVAKYQAMGYKAIRAQSGVPGLKSTYGVGRGSMFYEPAERGTAPLENAWSTEAYIELRARSCSNASAQGVRTGSAPAARRASSPDADRGGARRQEPGAVSAVLAGRSGSGGTAGRLPPDPPAHGDADRRGRGVQRDLRTATG